MWPGPVQDDLGAATPVPATGHSQRGPRPEVWSRSRPPLHSTHQTLPTLAPAPAGHGAVWRFGELSSKEGFSAAEVACVEEPTATLPTRAGNRAGEQGATPGERTAGSWLVTPRPHLSEQQQLPGLVRRGAKSSPPAARGQAPTLRHGDNTEGAGRACFLSMCQLSQLRNRLALESRPGAQARPPPGPMPSGKAICSAALLLGIAVRPPTLPQFLEPTPRDPHLLTSEVGPS